jgi:hypothetical protein
MSSSIKYKSSLRIQHFRNIGGESNERGACVNGGASILKLKDLVTELNLLKLDFPISSTANWRVLKLSNIGGMVNATENSLPTILFSITNTEREDGFVKKLGIKHLVEWGLDVVNSDRVVSKTKNPIKPA